MSFAISKRNYLHVVLMCKIVWMNTTLYITRSGTLSRKDNTLLFENTEVRKVIPIEGIDTIYLFGETSLNTKLLNFLSQKSVNVHVFNYYGFYSGSYVPKDKYVSGKLLVEQVNHYSDYSKRLFLAQKFVEGIGQNVLQSLNHYNKHGDNVKQPMAIVKKSITKIKSTTDIFELMSVEGGIWDTFYRSFNTILTEEFRMESRVKRPPDNPINAMISFGNSILYTQILSQIYQTQLNPTISYLHEPFEKRFSLALDIAEVFKPHIVFKLIFKIINKRMIKIDHFDSKKNYCLLNETGRKIFIEEFDRRLNETVEHPVLKRSVSHKLLFRLECYKLIKHLLGEKEYSPYLTAEV